MKPFSITTRSFASLSISRLSKQTLPLALSLTINANAGEASIPIEEAGLTLGLLAINSDSIFRNGKSQDSLVPFIEAYWGPFFISGTRLGSFIAGNDDWHLHLNVGIEEIESDDRDDSAQLRDMKKFERVYDLALSGEMKTLWGDFGFNIANDISNTHKGINSSISYAYPFSLNKHHLVPSLQLNWLNRDITNYYYGVKANEQTNSRPAYTANNALISTINVNYEYSMTKHHSFLLSIGKAFYSSEITDSPIVSDKQSYSIGAGYFYSF